MRSTLITEGKSTLLVFYAKKNKFIEIIFCGDIALTQGDPP